MQHPDVTDNFPYRIECIYDKVRCFFFFIKRFALSLQPINVQNE
ncbi:hypothetical protein BFO_0335 [Tannerella forsythia 92A2]|uniref:Uncharacterized protein n=1 Tax=Tannerella forsythia (strain ATCC 43037 / JCM 10827 / CCUG 21028 A / KCTC 5666 / FDC 338) TaxID=203275 RepID=G8UK31_TANFA|nr:hypothetical protein BFO_0335 [Tannerella forsythia 92A2]